MTILERLEQNEIVGFKMLNNDTVAVYEGVNGQGYIDLNKKEFEALIQELTELKDKMI